MAQRERALATPTEDLSLGPKNHMKELTVVVTPEPEAPTPQTDVGTYTQIPMPTGSHILLQVIKKNKNKYLKKEAGNTHASLEIQV